MAGNGTTGAGGEPARICVVTSYTAAAEPRAPRHALAARMAFPDADIVFVDIAPAGAARAPDPMLLKASKPKRLTLEFPTRAASPVRLAGRKLATRLGRAAFSATGVVNESIFGDKAQGLARALRGVAADVYIAHNIETLWPAINAAKSSGGSVVFDCMEYYSDMGDSQHPVEARAARVIEGRCLSSCALVIASSDELADVLAAEYSIARPLPAYNVPPRASGLPPRKGGGLNLYWRNSVVGFGQRGLEDALAALVQLPEDVRLYLQGRLPADGGRELNERVAAMGLRDRVFVLPPYAPEEAVQQAAPFDVGLCLERRGPRNHDLTVSNKMFDYHMGGLAVIATDLPGLASVIRRSRAGLVCEPGDPASLVSAIGQLRSSPERLTEMQSNARRFAMEEANLELELEKIAAALKGALRSNQNVVAP